MATIRPDNLEPAGAVNPGAAIIVDQGATVNKATPLQVVDAAIPLASQAAAEAGSGNEDRMSSLRVRQAIAAQALTAEQLAEPEGASLVGFAPFDGEGAIRTLEDKARDTVSVRDFWLAGDVDWTNAFIRAHSALVASNANHPATAFQTAVGGVIFVPKGRYVISRTIAIDSWGVSIEGVGRGSAIEAAPEFDGTEAFLFTNDPLGAISDVGIRGLTFHGNDQAVSLARFVRCRDLMWVTGCSAQYLNAPLVVLDRCEQWEIVGCYWIPFTVEQPTASGIVLLETQEGRIDQCKLFGWSRDSSSKTTGHMIEAHVCEELRITNTDGAFFGGAGFYQDRCFYVQMDKFQVESSTYGIFVTSEAENPTAADNLYCVYQGLILDGSGDWLNPVIVDYSIGAVIKDFGNAAHVTFGPLADRCQAYIAGGRGALFTDNGTNNLMVSDASGRMLMHKGGIRIAQGPGVYEAEGAAIFRSTTGGSAATSLTLQSSGAGFSRPLIHEYRWDFVEAGGGMRLGPYRFWVDGDGRLRMKNSAPTSDTDGTLVGSQS